jgi:glycosyl transferase family 25
MKIFYINMARSPERRAFMEEQFARLGLETERFEVLTPSSLTDEDRLLYCDRSRSVWMTEAELCCNYSHISIWRMLTERGIDRALILEDDVKLSTGLPDFLSNLKEINADYPIVRIETLGLPARISNVPVHVASDAVLRRSYHHDAGSAGYIITKQAAAVLAEAPEARTTLVDGLLFNPFGRLGGFLKVHYADPGLCIQLTWAGLDAEVGLGQSNLVGERAERKLAWKKKPIRKFARQVRGWITYDARAFAIKLSSGAIWWKPRLVPFKE